MLQMASLSYAHPNGARTESDCDSKRNTPGIRRLSGVWIISALCAVTACAPALDGPTRDSSERFVCTGNCSATRAKIVAACTKQPKISPLGLANAEAAFKKCLAENGYADGRFLASNAKPVTPKLAAVRKVIEEETQSTTAIAQIPPANSRTSKSDAKKPTAVTRVRRKKAVQVPVPVAKQPAKTAQASNVIVQKPREFDPQDLFKPGLDPSIANVNTGSKKNRGD